MNRRRFLRSATLTPAILIGTSLLGQQKERPDPLKPELVKDFVTKGHNDFEGLKLLLAETPKLLNSTWDWGGGDFETALGGAGHMGRTDIAEFLIRQGARIDIFVASMLGKIEIVKSIVLAYPDVLKSRGPHGLSLIHHAEMGGANALPVLEYFRSMGLVK